MTVYLNWDIQKIVMCTTSTASVCVCVCVEINTPDEVCSELEKAVVSVFH